MPDMTSSTHPKMSAALLSELDAIAGDYLADALAAWRAGSPTIDEHERIDTYIREELQPGGLLTQEHLLSGVDEYGGDPAADRRAARKLHRDAVRFVEG